MSFHGIGICMILIGTASFESARPARARAKKTGFLEPFRRARAHARAGRAGRAHNNISVQDPLYGKGTHQGNLVFFLNALTRIGTLWQCFGGGWGPLQNPKHGLKTSDASTKSKTWVKKRGGHPGLQTLFGIL